MKNVPSSPQVVRMTISQEKVLIYLYVTWPHVLPLFYTHKMSPYLGYGVSPSWYFFVETIRYCTNLILVEICPA
jgi:hypothetical protein